MNRRNSEVYRYPEYYDIGYSLNNDIECNFVESVIETYGRKESKRLFDIGCGSGRHLLSLARGGHHMTGVDLSPEMVRFVQDKADQEGLNVRVFVGDLAQLSNEGRFDAAYCLMDTFRVLLTNEQILNHLKQVAECLEDGGLYLIDFWAPREWGQVGNELYQWERSEYDTKVSVIYLQHPESSDILSQTFDEELVFQVEQQGETEEIRGGRTRSRLILPQEFAALVEASGAFELVKWYSDYDVNKEMNSENTSWRMLSVLKKR